MTLKIRLSRVGANERVNDSKQPVHSWNDRYSTDGLGAWRNCSAIATPIHGGSAMTEAVAVQYLMNPRRLMPALRSDSPTVRVSCLRGMASSPQRCRGGSDLRAQVANTGGYLVGCARQHFRYPAHFEQFGNQFTLLVHV